LYTAAGDFPTLGEASTKRADTVGQPPSAEIWVPKMPSLKAKKLKNFPKKKYS